jgi:protein HOOK3
LAALESSAPIPVPVPTGPSPEEKEKYMRLEIDNKQLQEEVAQLTAAAEAAAAASALAAVSLNETNESAIESMKEEIEALKTQLEQKEKENEKIVSDKERLEAYTKKTLSKFQDKYLVALQDCKTKLKEKQDKIESLEQRSVSERAAQKREERLLSSTIYELGLAIMQNKLKGGS